MQLFSLYPVSSYLMGMMSLAQLMTAKIRFPEVVVSSGWPELENTPSALSYFCNNGNQN